MIIEIIGGMLMFWCGLKSIIDWHQMKQHVPPELRTGYVIFGGLCLFMGTLVLVIVTIKFVNTDL